MSSYTVSFHNLHPNIPEYRSPYAGLKRGLLKYQLSNIANMLQFLLAQRLLQKQNTSCSVLFKLILKCSLIVCFPLFFE